MYDRIVKDAAGPKAPLGALGEHHLMELYACNVPMCDDVDVIRRVMLEGARRSGATVVGERFHKFAPQGVSGVVILAESHLAVHSWPEHGYVAVDLFGCGDKLDVGACFDYLAAELEASGREWILVPRGEPEPIARHAAYPAARLA